MRRTIAHTRKFKLREVAPPAKGSQGWALAELGFSSWSLSQELVCFLWVPKATPVLLSSSQPWPTPPPTPPSQFPPLATPLPTLPCSVSTHCPLPPSKRFVLALNPSVPSSPSFPCCALRTSSLETGKKHTKLEDECLVLTPCSLSLQTLL